MERSATSLLRLATLERVRNMFYGYARLVIMAYRLDSLQLLTMDNVASSDTEDESKDEDNDNDEE